MSRLQLESYAPSLECGCRQLRLLHSIIAALWAVLPSGTVACAHVAPQDPHVQQALSAVWAAQRVLATVHHPLVQRGVTALRKPLSAMRADVRLLSRVRQQVPLEVIPAGELFTAAGTHV